MLEPSTNNCYRLNLPERESDDRLNLNVRTGSASTLHKSFIFTFGGLTVGLELHDQSIDEVVDNFVESLPSDQPAFMDNYLLGELFHLRIIEKTWRRVDIGNGKPRPQPRLFHEVCAFDNKVYIFGGLVIPPEYQDKDVRSLTRDQRVLVPCNDLWEFNMENNQWTCLDDGSKVGKIPHVPEPRYNHKMTPVCSLGFVGKSDHFGLFIAGGKDKMSQTIYENSVFDLIEKKYIAICHLKIPSNPLLHQDVDYKSLDNVNGTDITIDYTNSVIVNFHESESNPLKRINLNKIGKAPLHEQDPTASESIIAYTPVKKAVHGNQFNPLMSFRLGKSLRVGHSLPFHHVNPYAKDGVTELEIVPYNLKYPTGGIFGQNVVITGFLPEELDISIFIFNIPTGKWSRLNVFCDDNYGSHRFWGGFVWQSHHKVALIGNGMTTATSSNIRYFNIMLLVSLPVTNVLISSELSITGDGDDNVSVNSGKTVKSDNTTLLEETLATRRLSTISQTTPVGASFNDYVHYAAPKSNFTARRSVFPPAAVTLGRKAFDRFGDLISDFELISFSGDRIPVSLQVLIERWGRYFIEILARGYVNSIHLLEKSNDNISAFENNNNKPHQNQDFYQNSNPEIGGGQPVKEVPHFRLPFQELGPKGALPVDQSRNSSTESFPTRPPIQSLSSSVDPHEVNPPLRKPSASAGSSITYLGDDIPTQPPIPNEPIPAVPSSPMTYKSGSRTNSTDFGSPRASLLHTLSLLRNPATKSPRDSPFSSPRPSVSLLSGRSSSMSVHGGSVPPILKKSDNNDPKSDHSKPSQTDNNSIEIPGDFSSGYSTKKRGTSTPSLVSDNSSNLDSEPYSKSQDQTTTAFSSLLDFDHLNGNKSMEPSLITRKLYMPYSTLTLKSFCEYLYTGQVGNDWLLTPTTLDNLQIAKFFDVPFLYVLISEVLFGIIGRKEYLVLSEGKKLKDEYFRLLHLTKRQPATQFHFPLDDYEKFIDTVDDGYFDVSIMKQFSDMRRESADERHHQHGINRAHGKMPSEMSDDSTKSSDDLSDSDSENDISLKILERPDEPHFGPRSKSIFDRANSWNHDFANAKLTHEPSEEDDQELENLRNLTLEHISSPTSPPPSDNVIDMIYETAVCVADIKLILRALNVRQMSKLLNETQDTVNSEIAILTKIHQKMLDQPQQTSQQSFKSISSSPPSKENSHPPDVGTEPRSETPQFRTESRQSPALKPTRSTSSLSTLGSVINNVVYGNSEKSKTIGNLRSPAGSRLRRDSPLAISGAHSSGNTATTGGSRMSKLSLLHGANKGDRDRPKDKKHDRNDKHNKHNNEVTAKASYGGSPTPSITSSSSSKKHHGFFSFKKK